MLAVRGTRALALMVVVALALVGAVFGVGWSAKADPGDSVSGDVSGPTDFSTVQVYLSEDLFTLTGALFQDAPMPTNGSGQFQFDDVPNGSYFVVVDAGGDWIQSIQQVTVSSASEVLPTFALEQGVVLQGTVRDALAVSPTGVPQISVCAYGDSAPVDPPLFPLVPCWLDLLTMQLDLPNGVFLYPYTPVSGSYRIVVPRGDDYELDAFDAAFVYAEQTWDHIGGCGCSFDPINVPAPSGGASPAGPYDFDLFPDVGLVEFDVLALNGAATPIDGMTARLFYGAPSGLVAIDHADTDLSGLVDVYGSLDGDYALKFAIGTSYYPVTSYFDGFGTVTPSDGCVVHFPGLTTGDLLTLDFHFDLTHPCGYVPPSTSKPATKKPRFTSASSFAALIAPTPTPTPTPTSSPSPSSGPSSEPSPSPSSTPPPVVNQGFDMWWLWIVLAIIVALIIFFLARLLLRRP